MGSLTRRNWIGAGGMIGQIIAYNPPEIAFHRYSELMRRPFDFAINHRFRRKIKCAIFPNPGAILKCAARIRVKFGYTRIDGANLWLFADFSITNWQIRKIKRIADSRYSRLHPAYYLRPTYN